MLRSERNEDKLLISVARKILCTDIDSVPRVHALHGDRESLTADICTGRAAGRFVMLLARRCHSERNSVTMLIRVTFWAESGNMLSAHYKNT